MLDMPSLSRNVSNAPSGNPAPRRRQRRSNSGPGVQYYQSGELIDEAHVDDIPSETHAIYLEIYELVRSDDMKQLRMEIISEVSLFIKESINLERQYRQEENARNQPSSGNNA